MTKYIQIIDAIQYNDETSWQDVKEWFNSFETDYYLQCFDKIDESFDKFMVNMLPDIPMQETIKAYILNKENEYYLLHPSMGRYIIYDKYNGKFSVMVADEFEERYGNIRGGI